MKQIFAYIKQHKLSDVTSALHQVNGLTGISVVLSRGFGRGKMGNEDHGTELADFVTHHKLEIMCKDELADEIVSTIQKAAHTGLRGDGKIYVSSVERAVRISTGEFGEDAT